MIVFIQVPEYLPKQHIGGGVVSHNIISRVPYGKVIRMRSFGSDRSKVDSAIPPMGVCVCVYLPPLNEVREQTKRNEIGHFLLELCYNNVSK